MKMNKNQALYKALPGCWITYSNPKKSDYKYACEVLSWIPKNVEGINKELIKKDILRNVLSFVAAGGTVGEEFSEPSINGFEFIEPLIAEDFASIKCRINPKTYYCEKCGVVKTKNQTCPKCNIKMKQLQMVYACECGYADGVKPPFTKSLLTYNFKDTANPFRFYTDKNAKIEMELMCPSCNNRITPKNASDGRIFNAQSGSMVNLFNKKFADAINEYKEDAELLIIAKWLNIISSSDFSSALDDTKKFFENKGKSETDPEVIQLARALGKTPAEIVAILAGADILSIDSVKNKINSIVPLSSLTPILRLITTNLIEFDTVKNPNSHISLEDAFKKGEISGSFIDKEDINLLLKKMNVINMQVSESVQIVKYSYGYTRLKSCPDSDGLSKSLRLRGFQNKVFTSVLETEGILIEIDMFRIFEWLKDNNIISNDLVISDPNKIKTWFMENMHLDTITHFTTISGQDNNLVTKVVYSLLHTISHMFIISAGKHSGLSKDSISEIIFPDACSIFIYPTSSEGITLGSIPGMFETELQLFLEDALKDNEICTFDPVCSRNQNGACVACTYLSEVSCTHFNKDLSRSYLYGGTIRINEDVIEINKGFWK